MNYREIIINLIGKIEENRLINGKKIDNRIISKFEVFYLLIIKSFYKKNVGLYYGSIFILLSLLFRSTIDIGTISGINLEIVNKIIIGKKYFKDFTTNDSPIFFIFLIPSIFLSKIFGVSPIILAEYYINLLAILSIFFSHFILEKSKKFTQLEINILILTFIIGFFYRFESSSLNNFITKNSLILICFYPYFSFYLSGIEKFKFVYKSLYLFLASTIIGLDLNYLIIILLLETYNFIINKPKNKYFVYYYFLLIILIFFYYFVIFYFFNEYIKYFKIISIYNYQNIFSNNHQKNYNFLLKIIDFFSYNLVNLLGLILIFFLKNNATIILKKINTMLYATFILLIIDNKFLDKLTFFYAVLLIYLIFNFLSYQQKYKLSLKKYWIFAVVILIFSSLAIDINELSINFLLYIFSFILCYLILINDKKFNFHKLLSIIILITSISCFYLMFHNEFKYKDLIIYSLFSINLLLILYIFLQSNYIKKFDIINHFVIAIFLIYLGLFVRVIILSLYPKIDSLKIYFNRDQHIRNIANLISEFDIDENSLLILSNDLTLKYPLKNYLKLGDNSEFISSNFLNYLKNNNQLIEEKFVSNILKNLDKNKFIISHNNDLCSISILEYFLIKNYEIKNFINNNFKYYGSYLNWKEDFDYKYNYTFENLNYHEKNIVDEINKFKKTSIKYEISEIYVKN